MACSVTIRMYNQQNLGDCFLLRFKEGRKDSFILIDFGSYVSGNDQREIEIAKSIAATVGNKPLTVVLTHQHKDHLSGFINAAATLQQLNIARVWFSYLDDPAGKAAGTMRNVTRQFWEKNKSAKLKARVQFAGVPAVQNMLNAKDNLDLISEHQTGGDAIRNLLNWSKSPPEFLLPGKNFALPGLSPEAVRVYVMGPPTDPNLLRKLNPSAGDAVNSLNAMSSMMNLDTSSTLMLDALNAVMPGKDSTDTENFPFNKNFAQARGAVTTDNHQSYKAPNNAWRLIDHDWLSEMGRLSLHMGNLTNNSSLVLAFELVASKKVLLFVADAQIGNWKSWMDLKFEGTSTDAKDLLSRTVFYKAGHHSSHNATLKEGLDMMKEDELVIMIPVNEKVSTAMGFAMLQPGMLKGYNRKSQGRVIRADTVYHQKGKVGGFAHAFKASAEEFTPAIRIEMDESDTDHLYIEHTIK